MKIINRIFILGFAVSAAAGIFTPALAKEALLIPLAYPQKSNAPKREAKRIEKPVLLNDKVFVNIAEIKPGQSKNPDLYVEYFLDSELIYSTQGKKESNPKKRPLGFTLDTQLYSDGRHILVVNLWDKDGPSAIGIKEIIIQNKVQNED